jgi:hypothetical protein
MIELRRIAVESLWYCGGGGKGYGVWVGMAVAGRGGIGCGVDVVNLK